RQREHVADVVEAIAHVVGGKILGGLELNTHQVANRVVVLGAIEPADGDPAWIALEAAIDGEERAIEPGHNLLALGLRWLGPAARRHVAGAYALDDGFPGLAILQNRRLILVLVERELRFGLVAAVTGNAILGQQRRDVLVIRRLCRLLRVLRAQHRHKENREQPDKEEPQVHQRNSGQSHQGRRANGERQPMVGLTVRYYQASATYART